MAETEDKYSTQSSNTRGTTMPMDAPVRSSPVYTGILPCQTIHDMLRTREIMATADIMPDQVQPASIDLRLGHYAYPVDTSFLPGHGVKVLDKMKRLDERFEDFKIPLKDGAVLEK